MPDLTEEFYSLKAKNVMERDVHCLTLRASVDDLNALLEKYVTGSKYGIQDYSIPILDSAESKVVVGATNVNSLLRLVESLEWEVQRQKQVHDLQLSGIANPEQRRRAQQKRVAKLRAKKYDLRNRVGSILLKAPITFDPDTPIEQIHVLFLTLRLKNAFVVKRGKLKGNITQKNLSKALKNK
jgi:CBS-domain-containing membrane protein